MTLTKLTPHEETNLWQMIRELNAGRKNNDFDLKGKEIIIIDTVSGQLEGFYRVSPESYNKIEDIYRRKI